MKKEQIIAKKIDSVLRVLYKISISEILASLKLGTTNFTFEINGEIDCSYAWKIALRLIYEIALKEKLYPKTFPATGAAPVYSYGNNEYDYLLKLVIAGAENTGKSCFLQQYANSSFPEAYQPTIGVEFAIRTVVVNDKMWKLQMWDTAG
mmetsp:Transcript_1742/g.1196  ORF Transcript_1742/g.1196 Transcript_1742/m.1196 type:complete len:150 (+) Transcript_1742:125-574(+)